MARYFSHHYHNPRRWAGAARYKEVGRQAAGPFGQASNDGASDFCCFSEANLSRVGLSLELYPPALSKRHIAPSWSWAHALSAVGDQVHLIAQILSLTMWAWTQPCPSTSRDSHTHSASIAHGMRETVVPTDLVHFKMTRTPKGMGLEGNATLPAMCLHWIWVTWWISNPMKPHPGKLV